jgi:flagellar basal body rod protein FlgF
MAAVQILAPLWSIPHLAQIGHLALLQPQAILWMLPFKTKACLRYSAANGQEAYTRAGKFHLDAQGFLINSSGLNVLNEQAQSVQIPVGSQDVVIQANGTITATLPGQKFETPVARLKLVNPAPHTLVREADGLFTSAQRLGFSQKTFAWYQVL